MMKKLKGFSLVLFLLVTPYQLSATDLKLRPFETDNCTMFVDGTRTKPGLWKHCCVEHDLRYWFGGSTNNQNAADLRLKACVEKVAGKTWANLIYRGVRAGHYSPIKSKYVWGWGWSEVRPKADLTPAETEYIINELKGLRLDDVNIDEFISLNFP